MQTFVLGEAVMIAVSVRVESFRRVLCAAAVFWAASFPVFVFAQPNKTKIGGFWVAGSASVTVKADEAILFLAIPGRAEDAAGALAENDRITSQVKQALVEQGLRGKYRFTGNQFIPGSAVSLGPAFSTPMALGPRPYYARPVLPSFCFEVRKYVIITFTEKDLSSDAFDQVVADSIDALTRAGARQPELPPQYFTPKNQRPGFVHGERPRPSVDGSSS